VILHHKSDKSEALYRGASDHIVGIDLGWVLGREGESVTDNLSRVTLKPMKTRTGGRSALRYGFTGGKFYPLDTQPKPPLDVLIDLVCLYPGRNQTELIRLAKGLSKHTVEETLNAAVLSRQIEARSKGKAIRYYLPDQPLEGAQ
jgi:hypothetical protein